MLNRVATLNPAGTNSWGNQFQARSGLSAPNYGVAQTQATQFQALMAASIRPTATFQAYARQAYTSTGIAATYAAQMQRTALPIAQEAIYDGGIWNDWGPTLGFGTIPSSAIPILVDSDIYIDGSGNVTAFGDAAVGINATQENGGTTCVTARVTGPGGYFGTASGCAPSSGIQVNLTGLPAATVSGVYTIWAHGSFYVNQGGIVLQGVADSVVSETWSPAAPCAGLQPPAITSLLINNGPMTQLAAGSSGTMLVMGSCLDQSQVSVSGGSVSTPSSGALIYYDGAQYDISQQFTVATGANPGDQTLTVTGPTSLTDNTGVEITPSSTPYIDWIEPSIWPAGESTNVTISGSGFGCSAPAGSICASGTVLLTNAASLTQSSHVSFVVSSWSDTSISGIAFVDQAEPGETLNVAVLGAGYGLGFAEAASQNAASGPKQVQAAGTGSITIKSSTPLWYFGQYQTVPSTFAQGSTSTVLTAKGVTGQVVWSVVQGTSTVSFVAGGASGPISSSGPTVMLYTIGYSTAANDVIVSAQGTMNGVASTGQIALSVDSPFLLVQQSVAGPTAAGTCSPDFSAGNNGWVLTYTWMMKSKFKQAIQGQAFNESFANVQQFQTTNLSYIANGAQNPAGKSTFTDHYCNTSPVSTPPTQVPQRPIGTNAVDSAMQVYSVGSATVGSGVPVQSQTLTRYTDHMTVTNIVSPVRSQ